MPSKSFRLFADFKKGKAEVRIGILRLPSQEVTHLVFISLNSTQDELTFSVSLPAARGVRARFEDGLVPENFEIGRLLGATVDAEGHVQLADGGRIQSVEIIPALLPYHLTELDWKILHETVAQLGIEEECRYDPGEGFRKDLRDSLFGSIDCSKLSGHKSPLLKTISARVGGKASLQKIADIRRSPVQRTAFTMAWPWQDQVS